MANYEAFRRLCDERGVKPGRVARETGVSTATLTSWKQGKYSPKADKIQLLADYFGVLSSVFDDAKSDKVTINVPRPGSEELRNEINAIRPRDLFLEKNTGFRISKRIPVLGRVAAGLPIEAQEEIIDWEEITGSMVIGGEYFGLQIKGDSMEPKFSNGDVVIVRKQEDADDGDIVIALVNGSDAICKRLRKYQDGIALVSTNPLYEPMYFSGSDIDEVPVRIIGKVKELRAKF